MEKEKYNYEIDCYCNGVPCEQIRKCILDNSCNSTEEVQKHLRVANRCKMCKPFIDEWCKINRTK